MNLYNGFNDMKDNKKSKYSVCIAVYGVGVYDCVSITYTELLMYTQVSELQEVAG